TKIRLKSIKCHHHFNQLKSTAGHRSFVGSSTIHGPGPLASSGSSDLPEVTCPPRWGPTYDAFTGAGSPLQPVKTSIGSPSCVPCPVHLQLRDSLSYVSNSSSSMDLLLLSLLMTPIQYENNYLNRLTFDRVIGDGDR
ncbi:jg26445, partial [Pararge aegeria aegeria]